MNKRWKKKNFKKLEYFCGFVCYKKKKNLRFSANRNIDSISIYESVSEARSIMVIQCSIQLSDSPWKRVLRANYELVPIAFQFETIE
jgi:hypothetical protein